jgi:polar amino acid transport system substrate-binding protein
VVVKKDSPAQKIADLKGKTLATLKGSVQAKWFEDHMPDVKTLRMNSAADALQAFRQGRADAYTHDAATLVVVADNDKDARLIGEPFQISDAAIGVRKNEEQWRDFLSAAVLRMREEHLYRGWVEQFVPKNIQGYYISVFEQAKPAESL